MLRTLVVEGNADNRNGLCNTLHRFLPYMELDATGDAYDALQRICTQQPDLVLLDASLPDQSGFALAHRIRDLNEDVIIVMLAGDDRPEYRLDAVQSGATGYLPTAECSTADLLSVIESAMCSRQFSDRLH